VRSDLIARVENIQTTWGPSEANAVLIETDEEARIRTASLCPSETEQSDVNPEGRKIGVT
jgi:hypothetical protein